MKLHKSLIFIVFSFLFFFTQSRCSLKEASTKRKANVTIRFVASACANIKINNTNIVNCVNGSSTSTTITQTIQNGKKKTVRRCVTTRDGKKTIAETIEYEDASECRIWIENNQDSN